MQPRHDLYQPLTQSADPATLSTLSKDHRDVSAPYYNIQVREIRSRCEKPISLSEVLSLQGMKGPLGGFSMFVVAKDDEYRGMLFVTVHSDNTLVVSNIAIEINEDYYLPSRWSSYVREWYKDAEDLEAEMYVLRFDLRTVKRVLVELRGCGSDPIHAGRDSGAFASGAGREEYVKKLLLDDLAATIEQISAHALGTLTMEGSTVRPLHAYMELSLGYRWNSCDDTDLISEDQAYLEIEESRLKLIDLIRRGKF